MLLRKNEALNRPVVWDSVAVHAMTGRKAKRISET